MAAKKKMKLSVKAPSAGPLATSASKEDQEWKVKEDADRVRRYAELSRDKDRHKKALDHIMNEHRSMIGLMQRPEQERYESDKGSMQPRAVARAGRKKSARVGRKTSRR